MVALRLAVSDLLALTCQAFVHIVILAHAVYRSIHIHSRCGSAHWATIAARPDCTAGVRCFVLFDQSEEDHVLYPPRRLNL